MGLLDDAIRDHLDLKRRRGADPAEVERAEREALGPVRRGPQEPVAIAPADEPDAGYDREDDAAWDQLAHDAAQGHEDLEFDDGYEYRDEYPEPPPAASRVDLDQPPPSGSDVGVAGSDERALPDAVEFSDHGAPAGEPPLPHQAPPGAYEGAGNSGSRAGAGGETAEYDVERAMEREPDAGGTSEEDMLQETPEFLQDTPDHDRLWFEQRPPKDFDFDG